MWGRQMVFTSGSREYGFTILEVLISLAIISFITIAFFTMMDFVRKDIKTANRKVDALELRTTAARSLGDLPTCACQLNAYGGTFDSTTTDPEFPIDRVKATCDPTAATLLATNEVIPGSTGNLEIGSIKMIGIQPMGVTDRFRGRFHVEFKSDNYSHPMKGFEIEVRFRTDPASPADAKKLVQCDFVGTAGSGGAAAGGGGGVTGVCPRGQYVSAIQNGAVSCSGVSVGGMTSNTRSGYSLATPGPGCDGTDCVTGDFGPCQGTSCVTNGNFCDGTDCVACGPAPSCAGTGCNSNRPTVCPDYGF